MQTSIYMSVNIIFETTYLLDLSLSYYFFAFLSTICTSLTVWSIFVSELQRNPLRMTWKLVMSVAEVKLQQGRMVAFVAPPESVGVTQPRSAWLKSRVKVWGCSSKLLLVYLCLCCHDFWCGRLEMYRLQVVKRCHKLQGQEADHR